MGGAMSEAIEPIWWVGPNETDILAWIAILFVIALGFCVVHLYARFDKWAEEKSKATLFSTTIPTLLTIALLYELFPLDHFSILLPISAALLAVTRDIMKFLSKRSFKRSF